MSKPQFDFSKLLGRMKEYGYTQQTMAESIGMNKGTMSQKLNNHSFFASDEIDAISVRLDILPRNVGIYFFCKMSSSS